MVSGVPFPLALNTDDFYNTHNMQFLEESEALENE